VLFSKAKSGVEMSYLTTSGMLLLLLLIGSGNLYAASLSNISIDAVILSKSRCRFVTTTATLDFGSLDPSSGVPVASSTTMTIRCGGSADPATFLITDDEGVNSIGPGSRRMQHTTLAGNFIPYSLSYTPATDTIPKNTNTPITINGSILGTDYQSIPPGAYSDTVVLTITP
jgi:spore coat protein U-like protein